MKNFWIVAAVVAAQYLVILGVFIGVQIRAAVRTRQLQKHNSDVIQPKDLASSAIGYRPSAISPTPKRNEL